MPKPQHDRVMIRVDEPSSTTPGGLVLAGETGQERIGTVVAVGPGRFSSEGVRDKIGLKEGDHVLWKDEYGAENVKDGNQQYLVLRMPSIVASW